MKALLTSSGIANDSIERALVELLGKPIAESRALVVPTGIYPFSVGSEMAARLLRGETNGRLVDLGWQSVGLLELSVLPSIDRDVWVSTLQATDALLVWGGDPLFLSYWLTLSGVADLLPSLDDLVYVGTSAGAMAATTLIGETYTDPPGASSPPYTSSEVVFGGAERTFVTAAGLGLVEFSIIPHLNNPNHEDASTANAEQWAGLIPAPTYAIDDQTAIKVHDGVVEVVSEGQWVLL